VLSRSAPEYRVDLASGEGLEPVLRGCDVVVDASNNAGRKAAAVLVDGTRRLLAVGQAAGVSHHVCMSIVGCDQLPMGYYRVKTDQENLVAQGPVPWTIVRATQFHELVAKAFGTAARWRVLPVPRALVQPIAAAEVARYVAGVAERPPRQERPAVAGPEVTELRRLARTWRSVTGSPLVCCAPTRRSCWPGSPPRTRTCTGGTSQRGSGCCSYWPRPTAMLTPSRTRSRSSWTGAATPT